MKRFFYFALRLLALLFLSGALPLTVLGAWVFLTPPKALREQPHLLIIASVMLAWYLGSLALTVALDHYEKRRKRM